MRNVFVLAADSTISLPTRTGPNELPSQGLMEQVHIRQHDGNSNLWWVSSPTGDASLT